METGADKTNVQEAKSGKGLKIDYATKVSTKKKTEKVVSKAKAGPKKEALLKKEVKVKTETKPAKSAAKTVTTKKKTETVTEPIKAKKATKKKSS